MIFRCFRFGCGNLFFLALILLRRWFIVLFRFLRVISFPLANSPWTFLFFSLLLCFCSLSLVFPFHFLRRICAVRFNGVAIARKIKEIIISWTISLSRAATRKIDNTKRNISVLKQHAKRPYSRNFSALKKTNISSKSHTNRTPTTTNFSMHRELEKRDREREREKANFSNQMIYNICVLLKTDFSRINTHTQDLWTEKNI